MVASVRSALSWGALGFLLLQLNGCAALYKVQLSDIESGQRKAEPVSIRVSETTVNLQEVAGIARGVGRAANSNALKGAGSAIDTYVALFQYGPRTGTPVYNEVYAREVPELLAAACKNGRLINITSVREARNYPVVKGEIVRVDALCAQP